MENWHGKSSEFMVETSGRDFMENLPVWGEFLQGSRIYLFCTRVFSFPFFIFCFSVLGNKSRALFMPCKFLATDLHY